MSETTTYEAPDAAAVAAKAVNDYQAETDDVLGEKMVLNMGPSHPATHGVLRLVLELDGEIIEKAEPHIGYLHRGDEKIAENMHYNQFVPYTDRLDYLAPLANNVAYACAVGKTHGLGTPSPWTSPARPLLRTGPHFLPHAGSGRLRHGRRRDDCLPLHLRRARKNLQLL